MKPPGGGAIAALFRGKLNLKILASYSNWACNYVGTPFKARKFEMGLRRHFCSHKCTLLEKLSDLRFYPLPLFEIKFYV